MEYFVQFSERVKTLLINHTLEVPDKECGGFLYGNFIIAKHKLICDVQDIYYEKKYGTNNSFRFDFRYICNAIKREEELYPLKLLGSYHSHGENRAILSKVDRDELQKFFGVDKVTVVYSTKYNEMVCEYLDLNGESYKAKVLVKK